MLAAMRLALCVACAGAWVPPHVEEALKEVTFSGGLANPISEFHESRWEWNVGEAMHERFPNLRDFYETDSGSRVGSAGAAWNDDKLDDIMSSMPDRNDHGENADARDMKNVTGGDEKGSAPCDTDDGACDSMPTEFSWYAFHGQGLLTHNINQHLPKYCADCWLTAASSMLADRIKIARYAGGGSLGPDIHVAMQTVLNCGKRTAGTCESGTIHGVFDYIDQANGVPYETCMNYDATDAETCDALTYCKSCKGTGNCFGVPAKPSYDPKGRGFWFNGVPKVEMQSWGYIGTLIGNTVRDLQIEIITRGPIACMVDPVPFNAYKDGIIDKAWDAKVGYAHTIEVVGWGEKNGEKFWHVRNSWGEYWGERGFARVLRGAADSTSHGAVGIEGMCAWAVPNKWGQVMSHFGENFVGKKDHDGSSKSGNSSSVSDDDMERNRDTHTADDSSYLSSSSAERSLFDEIASTHAGEWNQEAVEKLWKTQRPWLSGDVDVSAASDSSDLAAVTPVAKAQALESRPAETSSLTLAGAVVAGLAVFAGGFLSGRRSQKSSSYVPI